VGKVLIQGVMAYPLKNILSGWRRTLSGFCSLNRVARMSLGFRQKSGRVVWITLFISAG
jgi:hypothetical protein